MTKQLLPGLRMTLLLTVLTGFLYPGLVTLLCQLIFSHQANGSLVMNNGRVAGSERIGQNFTRPEYFWSRPSAAGNDGYDPAASGGSNLGPTSRKLAGRVAASVEDFRKKNPDYHDRIPADLVTTSASGLDPDISPEAAAAQEARVAKARGTSLEQLHALVVRLTEARDLGFLGEPRVNVLRLNLALDSQWPARR